MFVAGWSLSALYGFMQVSGGYHSEYSCPRAGCRSAGARGPRCTGQRIPRPLRSAVFSIPGQRDDTNHQPTEPPEPCPERVWAGLGALGGMTTWRKLFPGTPEQVSDARRLARIFLDDTSSAVDAEWIVGELAKNAVMHSRSGEPGGVYLLELKRIPVLARLAVYDLGGIGRPTFVRPVTTTGLPETGYGLRAVAQLAIRTGVRGNLTIGHAVWADLPVDAHHAAGKAYPRT